MDPFSIISNLPSLPSLPSSILRRRTSNNVVKVVVQTSSPKHSHHPPDAPTTLAPSASPSKPRSNPQAILPADNDDYIYQRLTKHITDAEENEAVTKDRDNYSPSGEAPHHHHHTIHATIRGIAPESPRKTPHTVHSAQSTSGNTSVVLSERAPADSNLDRVRVLKPLASDAIQAITMISQPRPMHMRHTRSYSTPSLSTLASPVSAATTVASPCSLSPVAAASTITTTPLTAKSDQMQQPITPALEPSTTSRPVTIPHHYSSLKPTNTAPAIPTPVMPTSSLLSSWKTRSGSILPNISRPSPLMSLRAALSVVSSVTSVGSGLLPSKEQLRAIPVAGRILNHPVIDSTLSYIATKASERGIDLAVLTGGADPKTAIPSRDIPYRKLNKELIQLAVKLSELAIQKEDQSAAMGDDASDDAFELYLASIGAMLHALPCATTILFSPDETCDAFRRETFESQLYGFLNSELENISEEYLSDTSHSKQHRHRRRRRHREQHHRATALIRHHTVATNQPIYNQHLYVQRQDRKLRREQHTKRQRKLKKAVQAQQLPIQAQGHKCKYGRSFQHFNMASPVLSPTQASCLGSKCSCHRHRSHHTFSIPTLEFDTQTKTSSNHSLPGSVSGSGISDTIISTAVHSAIRLKQSPIPDAVKTCLRTSKNILHKVDERFHLQEKAWKLSKQSIEKAVELDEQYAIHRLVAETVFATLTGLVKAGIAYKETPSYGTTRVTDIEVTENPNAVGATSPQRFRHVSEQRHSKTRQYWAKSQGRDEPGLFAANASGKKGRGALSAVTNSGHRPNFEANWAASFSDSGDSDSDIATASISSSRISSCTSSDDEETTEEDEKLLDFKQQTLLSFDLSRASPILSSVTPPCSEQVREKIDMMMALKGAASLIAGNLYDK